MNELQIKVNYLDSREVATMVGKRHDHLIRDIKNYCEYLNAPNLGEVDFFVESTYKDGKGEIRRCYQITKKGCELIAHKMTGKKGVQFTANYINRFHEMENELQQQSKQLQIEEPYVYKDKYYNGQQVVTIRDIEHFTKIQRCTILYYLKQLPSLKHGIDYMFLEGEELRRFKEQNACVYKLVNSLYVITKKGFVKLVKALGCKIEESKYFKPSQVKHQPLKEAIVNIKDIPNAEIVYDAIMRRMIALDVMLKGFDQDQERLSKHETNVKAIGNLATELCSCCKLLQTLNYSIIQ